MTQLVFRDSIQIAPDRQRTQMDPLALQDLASSIQAQGLLQAPVVDEDAAGLHLVAGGRRLAATELIHATGDTFTYGGKPVPEGMVPVLLLRDLTPLQRIEIELEENIRREDLSWQDRAAAVSRVVALKRDIAESQGRDRPSDSALAQEIGRETKAVISDLVLTRHMEDPAIAKAKTKAEALKVLARKVQAESNVKLAEAVGKVHIASRFRCLNENCLEWMAQAEPAQFDVIITDPPYGMGADEFGDSGGMAAGAHGYTDDYDTAFELTMQCPALFDRVTKADAHLYLFCDLDWFARWKEALSQRGWRVHRTPLVWHKPNGMRAPWPEQGPWRRYELILYAVKGGKKTTGLYPDLVTIPSDENLGHSAQKPVALYTDLLRRSCIPGDSVLDPFCGSGPVFEAAEALKCYATGVEMDLSAYGISLKRLEKLGG